MSNLFATKPDLPPIALARTWTCPVTGLMVPKDPAGNLQWRAGLLEAAEEDAELRTDLYTASSQSILFWINAFVFTHRLFEAGEDGEVRQATDSCVPFVTWPIQDKHILRLEYCIDEGESLLTDKSRDMGATWDHIAALTHRLIFRANESHLMISRKEDAVDVLDGVVKNYPHGSLSDPGTLFGKIDYILHHLPEWMLPKMSQKKMHLVNTDNRTRIDGESSNATAGSSDRRTSIFLDEMAKMKEAESIKRSTKDVTACRFPCSTPNGAGTTYSKWRMSGQIPVFILPWWEHPEKGAGRYAEKDDLGRWKIRSPWYNRRCAEDSPKEIAIELDMDHVGSGDTFFESNIIEQHRKLFARPPRCTRRIDFSKMLTEEQISKSFVGRPDLRRLRVKPKGPWKVWCNLINGRPDQTRTYTLGIDISKGQGASNSTISVLCNETGEKIAAFADASVPPHQFARLACAAALWIGGRRLPLMVWENNGDPGHDFGHQLVQVYHYPNIYFDRQIGTVNEKRGKRYGWRSSPEKKAAALGGLRKAYALGTFINRDEDSLNEATTYISFEGGGIGPAELVNESEATRKAHGDRVIADMLCVWGARDKPKYKRGELRPPARSIGYRMEQAKRRRAEAQKKQTFDFSGVG